MVDRRELGAIFLGGLAGALLRAALVEILGDPAPSWPWATFAVNVAGALLLGILVTRLQERLPISTYRRPLAATGFCGALTTFSTMQVELLKMLEAGRVGLGIAYLAASLAAGFVGVHLATGLGRRLRLRS
ncbi:MAG: fluoride efflux transporter CrcB [Solirubrobacterales bacterium]